VKSKFNKTELFGLSSAGLIISQLMLGVLDHYYAGHVSLITEIVEEDSDQYKLVNIIEILKKELSLYSCEIDQSEWLRSYEVYMNIKDELNHKEIFNLFFEYWNDGLFDPSEDNGWFIGDVKAIYYFKEVIKLTDLK